MGGVPTPLPRGTLGSGTMTECPVGPLPALLKGDDPDFLRTTKTVRRCIFYHESVALRAPLESYAYQCFIIRNKRCRPGSIRFMCVMEISPVALVIAERDHLGEEGRTCDVDRCVEGTGSAWNGYSIFKRHEFVSPDLRAVVEKGPWTRDNLHFVATVDVAGPLLEGGQLSTARVIPTCGVLYR